MMCAAEPGAITDMTVPIFTRDIILINWSPPADDGGSPILGYLVNMRKTGTTDWTLKYNGTENPGTKILPIT